VRSSGRGGGGPPSVYTNYQRVEVILSVLHEWLPSAVLTNGIVNAPNFVLRVPGAFWRDGALIAAVLEPQRSNTLSIKAVRQDSGSNSLTFESVEADIRGQMSLVRSADTVAASGTVSWLTNSIHVNAGFDRVGLFPQRASITGDRIVIPAHLLGHDDYRDIIGQFSGAWTNGQF